MLQLQEVELVTGKIPKMALSTTDVYRAPDGLHVYAL